MKQDRQACADNVWQEVAGKVPLSLLVAEFHGVQTPEQCKVQGQQKMMATCCFQ